MNRKQSIQISVIVLALSAIMQIQSSDQGKRYLKVINDAGFLKKFTVSLKQSDKEVSNTEKSKTLFYNNTQGPITLTVIDLKDPARLPRTYQPIPIDQLIGKDLHIVQEKRLSGLQGDWLGIQLKSGEAPKKQKIRAYKETNHDKESTVVITDAKGGKISESKFKHNTDRFAKSLYVRLNKEEIKDENDPNYKYNKNIVTVTQEGAKTLKLEIGVGEFIRPQEQNIEIKSNSIQLGKPLRSSE